MDVPRGAVYATGAAIVALTLVTGPFVGAVDVTQKPDPVITDQFGNGSADVTIETLPDSLTISKGRYDAQKYYLRTPDVVAQVSNVTGQPFLRYDVSIGELGYSTTTTAFLSPSTEGQTRLSLGRRSFEEDEIQRNRYNGTITILVRANGSDRIIERANVTVGIES